MRLADVVAAWRVADPKHIHPTREHVSEEAYWESGRLQAEVVHELLPEGGTVLDFGCGDGRIAIPLAKLGFEVYAVDAAPEMLERLRHQAKVQGMPVSEFRGDTDTPIYPMVWDGTYPWELDADAVNARAVFIHHTHADVEVIVRNLAPLIKPNGYLIADWPVGEHHERRDWIDVTTWDYNHRAKVAESAGLELLTEGVPTVSPSVWRKK